MADTQQETVSREAHERMTRERDDLKAQNAELSKAVNDFSLRDKAYEHFKTQDGITDPFGVANAAMRDVTLKDSSPDDLTGRLDLWLGEQRSIWGPTTTPTEPAAQAEPVVPGSTEVPGFVAPSPSSPGIQPQLPQVTMADLQKEYGSGLTNEIIGQYDRDGRLALRPEVRAAMEAQRG